jgi:hypothetical protein
MRHADRGFESRMFAFSRRKISAAAKRVGIASQPRRQRVQVKSCRVLKEARFCFMIQNTQDYFSDREVLTYKIVHTIDSRGSFFKRGLSRNFEQ